MKNKNINLSLPADVHEALGRVAKEECRSRSKQAAKILRDALRGKEAAR